MAGQPYPLSNATDAVRAPEDAVGRAWPLRDWMAAAALGVGTAATILWQNAHIVVLWDFSYVLDSAVRMADGQMPYRDFPFVHAPLTFLIQAAILRLFGRVFFHHALYAAMAGGASTVLAWRMALATLRGRVRAAWTISVLLAAPLIVLGIYCVVPLPNYDCDCGISILAAVWLLQRLAEETHPSHKNNGVARVGHPNPSKAKDLPQGFAAGVAACMPLFFKQNIGLPFLLAVASAAAWVLVMRTLPRRRSDETARARAPLVALFAGAAAALLMVALLLHFTAGIHNYLHWTIQFAAQRRLPGTSVMLGVYRDPTLLWTLPCVLAALVLLRVGRIGAGARLCARITAFALFAAPFLFALSSLIRYDDADERGDSLLALWPMLLILAAALAVVRLVQLGRSANLRALTPLVLLAAIHGAFLSQQLWGSTYGIWPLLVLLLAEMMALVAEALPAGKRDEIGADSLRSRSFPQGLKRKCLREPDGTAKAVPFQSRICAISSIWFAPALAALISVTLVICGGFYTASEERLSYAQFPEEPPMHSAFPELQGMATPGPYLPEFDELLRYAEGNIPESDGLMLIPGEDPFYFATGRVPRFPVLLFDPATDPYSPREIATLAQTRGIRWLIVKRDLQIKEDPTPQRAATLQLLLEEFTPAAHLRGYDVYRR
jgi:hypothetical protein